MLYFYRSNSQEYLLEQFQEIFASKQEDLLLADFVIIRNYGIKNWIQKKFVQNLGISANLVFLFPNEFLQKLMLSQLATNKVLLHKQEWDWKVLEVLLQVIQENNEFSRYLSQNHREEIYQLAKHLADIFQEYALFYPNIFTQKVQSPEYTLQKRIWEEIFFSQGYRHIFSLIEKELTKNTAFNKMPGRVFLFGISYLPEIYLATLSKLAEQIDIHFFYKTSTKEYFGGLLHPKSTAKKKIQLQESDLAQLHYQQGHSLLGFARKESEFQYFLLKYDWDNSLLKEKYFQPEMTTLLGKLQRSMFQLSNNQEDQNWQINNEQSITVQQCHNLKREVEELHRYILQILEQNLDLQPEDILVKTPAIDTYTPYIEEVFSHSENPIPYSISDNLIEHPEWFQNFLKLPNILKDNYFKKEIFELLECPEVLKKFCIEKKHLPKLQIFFAQANLYWGKDLTQIQKLEPFQKENFSWSQAKEKILNACILEQEITIEGQFYEIIGNFFLFLQTVFQILDLQDGLLRPQNLTQWVKSIAFILEELFEFSDEQKSLVLQIQSTLEVPLQLFQSKQLLHFEIIFAHFKDVGNQFFQQKKQGNFLKNGVNFCNIQPMRNIPFGVICFLGLDDKSFPRARPNSSLNLLNILQKENLLDFRKKINLTNTKNEDFYIFWEAILSAKKFFYISFVGWDLEGKSLLPSLALSIFLQFFCKKLQIKTYEELPFFHRHYLYMFDSRYFQKNSHYKNYSQYYYELAKIKNTKTSSNKKEENIFFHNQHPNKNLPVEEFYSFFQSPINYFVEKNLGVHFFEKTNKSAKYELYHLDGLQKYSLSKEWYKKKKEKKSNEQIMADFLFNYKTPPPQIFQKYWQQQLLFLENWHAKIDSYTKSKKVAYFSYSQTINDIVIFGGNNLWDERLNIQIEPSQWNNKKKQKLWLQHLFLCNTIPKEKPISYWIGKNSLEKACVYKIGFVPEAKNWLQKFIEFYCKGIKEPLAFHSKTFDIPFAQKIKISDLAPNSSYQEKEQYYWNLCFSNQSEEFFTEQIKYFCETVIQPVDDFLIEEV